MSCAARPDWPGPGPPDPGDRPDRRAPHLGVSFFPRLRHCQCLRLRVLPPLAPAECRERSSEALRREVPARPKDAALGGGLASPRRFVPTQDGYWDGYAYRIDARFPQLAADIARHRARRADPASP